MDDYCNHCGSEDQGLTLQANGRMVCDVCSYRMLQRMHDKFLREQGEDRKELHEQTVIREAKERLRKVHYA